MKAGQHTGHHRQTACEQFPRRSSLRPRSLGNVDAAPPLRPYAPFVSNSEATPLLRNTSDLRHSQAYPWPRPSFEPAPILQPTAALLPFEPTE